MKKDEQCEMCIPEVVLLDRSNGKHLTNFTSDTTDLDPNMRSTLDDLVCVVGELRRCGIAIELDV